MSTLTRTEDALELDLSGAPNFGEALAAVKLIPGRRFNGTRKVWELPPEPEVAKRVLETIRPKVDAALLGWVRASAHEQAAEITTPLPDDATLRVPWADRLYDYQRAAVDFAAEQGRLLLADDLGLGKTAQAVSIVAECCLRSVYETNTSGVPPAVAGGAPREGEGILPSVSGEEQGASTEAEPRKLRYSTQAVAGHDSGGEEQAVRGLRDSTSAEMHGLGSRARNQAVHAEQASKSEVAARNDSGSDDRNGASEVRRAVPQLSSTEALGRGPKLIVCPASVKGVWRREIAKWVGPDQLVVLPQGTPKQRTKLLAEGIERNAWIVVNYEQLRVEQVIRRNRKADQCKEPLFETTEWLAVIADEIHRIKNRKSLATRGLWRVDAPIKLGLSGTPVQNNPAELWALLRWLYPESYGRGGNRTPYWRFFEAYVDAYEGFGGHKVITGVRNPDALRFELSKRLVRRTKGQVLSLPEKTRERVPIDLLPPQRKAYEQAEKALWLEIEAAVKAGDKGAERLAQAATDAPTLIYEIPNGAARTVRLRQVASTPALLGGEDDSAKLDAAVEIIMDAQPKQMVVFSEFVGTCGLLVERLRRKGLTAESYTGAAGPDVRTKIEERFQLGDIDVVVGTIKAMKEGITLHAADTALFLERDWVPDVNTQCEDRLHRIGQRNAVTILILEGVDTVDTGKVAPTNALKSLMIGRVVERDEVREIERGDSNAEVE